MISKRKMIVGQMFACVFVVVILFMLCACGGQQNKESIAGQERIEPSELFSVEMETEDQEQGYTSEQWYRAYQTILNDWTTIEQYGDFEYLKMYFDSEYQFDNYWLCDVNSDEVPELFLHSDYMNITAVFTFYENEIRYLMYDVIYGVNKETGDVVIEGHWHGAGGSGVDEWTVYHITEKEAVYAYYIDFIREYEELEIENPYTVYDAAKGEFEKQADSRGYDEIYNVHVTPCIMKNEYQRYNLNDLTGLDIIQ